MRTTFVLAAALLLPAVSYAQSLDARVLFADPMRRRNIYVFSTVTNAFDTIYNGNDASVQQPRFSPDGKKVCFYEAGYCWVMNNDGSDLQRIAAITTSGRKGLILNYSTKGVFYLDANADVWHIDVAAKTNTKIYHVTGAKAGDGWGIWTSRDATRAIAWVHDAATESKDPKLILSPDLRSITHEWVDIWGHGWYISPNGQTIVINGWSGSRGLCGPQHVTFIEYAFDDERVVDCYPAMRPGDTPTLSLGRDILQCANNDDYFVYNVSDDAGVPSWRERQWYILNYQTGQRWTVDVWQTNLDPATHVPDFGNCWLGDLPSVYDDGPVLAVSPTHVTFTPGDNGPKTAAVSNVGTGTLTNVSVSDDAAWLTTSRSGTGNAQTISNTVDPSGLADGAYYATVSVFGGGAPNTVTYQIALNVGSSIVAPGNLAAEVLANNAEIQLTWTDNSTNETSFLVERQDSGGAWVQVGTATANATSYTDTGLPVGTYQFRVRATNGAEFSGYSAPAQVSIRAQKGVSILGPSAGDTLVVGEACHITWTASQVTVIEIQYSLDVGETWTSITAAGGIADNDTNWQDYTWVVPALAADSILIRVQEYQNNNVGFTTPALSVVADLSISGHGVRCAGGVALHRAHVDPRGRGISLSYSCIAGQPASVTIHTLSGTRVASTSVCVPADGHGVVRFPVCLTHATYIATLETGATRVARTFAISGDH